MPIHSIDNKAKCKDADENHACMGCSACSIQRPVAESQTLLVATFLRFPCRSACHVIVSPCIPPQILVVLWSARARMPLLPPKSIVMIYY
jgi:hypothetical protein